MKYDKSSFRVSIKLMHLKSDVVFVSFECRILMSAEMRVKVKNIADKTKTC